MDSALGWIGKAKGPWFCTVAFNAPYFPFHARLFQQCAVFEPGANAAGLLMTRGGAAVLGR